MSGIHTSLMNEQNGEQPCKLKPVQSSDEAKNAAGIAASNSLLALSPESVPAANTRSPNTFQALTLNAAMTSSKKGTASHHFISIQKSIANRVRSTAEATRPARSKHR